MSIFTKIISNKHIEETINQCIKNKYLNLVITLLCAYCLRRKNIYYVVAVYIPYALGFVITKSSIGYAIVEHFFNDTSILAKIILVAIDMFSGATNNWIFGVVTTVIILLIIQNIIVRYLETKYTSSDIKEIKDSLNYQSIHSNFNPAKVATISEDINCPIPSIHSSRAQLVNELRTEIENHKILLIYGGIKEGKSILSCLVAKSLKEYRIIKVPFANSNEINIPYLLKNYSRNDKIVFVFDAVKMPSEQYYQSFCQYISNIQSPNWAFIINSYEKISDYVFGDFNSFCEREVPLLTQKEVNEMIPIQKQSLFTPIIYGLLNGQPLLTQILCISLEKEGWTITEDELAKILTFPTGMGLDRKVRTLLRNFIPDYDGETYHLLNRLLFYGLNFTEIECQELASIEPIITNPLLHLNKLVQFCIKEDNGKYHISELLKKTLKIDLIDKEIENCAKHFVKKILSNKEISQFDVLRALSYLINAKCYDEAAYLYINVLSSISNNHKLNEDSYSILRAVWADLPLPEAMSFNSKLGIRMCQLTTFGSLPNANMIYVENDIDKLLELNTTKSVLTSSSMQALIAYYATKGNLQKVASYQKKIDPNFIIKDLISIDTKKIILVSLNGVKNKEDLYAWFELYISNNRPQYELLNDGAMMTINKLCETYENQEEILIDIYERSFSSDVLCFTIASCAKLIDIYSDRSDIDKATNIFNKHRELLDIDFGSILLNYSYGLCIYNNGDATIAKSYFELSCANYNIAAASMVAFNATCALAQIYGNNDNAYQAYLIINQLAENKSLSSSYTDYEYMRIYGTLSYSQWQNNDKIAAIHNLLKIEEFLWSSRNMNDDFYKDLSMRFNILVLYIYEKIFQKKHDPQYTLPDYGLFSKPAPGLTKDYNPLRNFTVRYLLLQIVENILDDEMLSIKMIEHIIQIQSSDGIGNGQMMSVLLESYPIMLRYDRKDLIEYIILKALADSVTNHESTNIDYELLTLLGPLKFIFAYRIICKEQNIQFDDEWIYSIIDKAVVYIKNPTRTKTLLNIMYDDCPNFHTINDDDIKIMAMLFHIDKIHVKDCLLLLYKISVFYDSIGKNPSAKKYLEIFANSYARLVIKYFDNSFMLTYLESDTYFKRIHSKGMEYVYDIIRGLEYKMKEDPIMSKELSEIL